MCLVLFAKCFLSRGCGGFSCRDADKLVGREEIAAMRGLGVRPLDAGAMIALPRMPLGCRSECVVIQMQF
uniref:Secreted protein n=1 Tax=Ixodes ricinus TaxID=34613 RepID=A0A147BV17_IXORI